MNKIVRPKITDAQWYFLIYYCGGNGHGSVSVRTQDSLEWQVAKECKALGLIKKKQECELVFGLTEAGRLAVLLDIREQINSHPYPDRSRKTLREIEDYVIWRSTLIYRRLISPLRRWWSMYCNGVDIALEYLKRGKQ